MSDGTPEPRTPVMILVEASWKDQSGTIQSARAQMENRSAGGACIRVKKRIGVGTKLRVQWRWEQFVGTARYCRSEGREYLVGIQRDRAQSATPKLPAAEDASDRKVVGSSATAVWPVRVQSLPKWQANKPAEIPEDRREAERVPNAVIESVATEIPARGVDHQTVSTDTLPISQPRDPNALRCTELQTKQPPSEKEAGKERKHMRRKWFEVGHKGDKKDGLSGNDNGNNNGKSEAVNRAALAAPSTEITAAERDGDGVASAQVELSSMEDIYRAAGIINPRKGYSISKVVEMLHSEHLRGLSKEARRASVLVALDAAGISVEEVLQDAKVRKDAIDSYEAEQRKLFEAQLARKAEENMQIQAELERVKARYAERLRRNLDGIAREKATFGNWQTLKQQESQSMAEAVEVCLKAPVSDPPGNSIQDVSLVDASAKPV